MKFKKGDVVYSKGSKNTIKIVGINSPKEYLYTPISGDILKHASTGKHYNSPMIHIDNNFEHVTKLHKALE